MNFISHISAVSKKLVFRSAHVVMFKKSKNLSAGQLLAKNATSAKKKFSSEPTQDTLSRLSNYCQNSDRSMEIFDYLVARLNDKDSFKHVEKTLLVFEYLLLRAHVKFAQRCQQEHKLFEKYTQYFYKVDGKDIAGHVTQTAKEIVALLENSRNLADKRAITQGKKVPPKKMAPSANAPAVPSDRKQSKSSKKSNKKSKNKKQDADDANDAWDDAAFDSEPFGSSAGAAAVPRVQSSEMEGNPSASNANKMNNNNNVAASGQDALFGQDPFETTAPAAAAFGGDDFGQFADFGGNSNGIETSMGSLTSSQTPATNTKNADFGFFDVSDPFAAMSMTDVNNAMTNDNFNKPIDQPTPKNSNYKYGNSSGNGNDPFGADEKVSDIDFVGTGMSGMSGMSANNTGAAAGAAVDTDDIFAALSGPNVSKLDKEDPQVHLQGSNPFGMFGDADTGGNAGSAAPDDNPFAAM